MKTLYIVMGVLLLFALLFFIIGKCRTRRAIKKVKARSEKEKLTDLNETLFPFGYCYDCGGQYFTTLLHSWQREMGYCRLYDESAISMNMVIDCEPVEFEYGGELYLIELWKGQYGMTTGAEVGVYKARRPANYQKGDLIFYHSVSDDELLPISLTLYKDGKVMMKKSARQWWLTVFALGQFSYPDELVAGICIGFPGYGMRNAFVQELLAMGYCDREIRMRGLSVQIMYRTPKTPQPDRGWEAVRRLVMKKNKLNCRRYLRLTSCFESPLDRIDFLRMRYKLLARTALNFGKITQRAAERLDRQKAARIRERGGKGA